MPSPTDGELGLVSPFDQLLGVRIVEAGPRRGVATVTVTGDLLQPGGIVHGGVYATLVETAASVAATAWLRAPAGTGGGAGPGAAAVGASNHTDFLRPMTGGDLTAVATPLQCGRRLQLWAVDVTDADGRRVAHGSVRLANVDTDRPG